MKNKTIILLFFMVIAIYYQLPAQVVIKGKPLFLDQEKIDIPTIKLPPINLDKLDKESSKKQSKNKVLNYAENIFYEIDIKKQALCKENVNGNNIYYLNIKSVGAYSLGLQFKKYYLPKGAQLYIYSSDKKHIRGAYTSANNKSNKTLAIAPVKGDYITIEYSEPAHNNSGELIIESVSHDFLNVFNYLDSKSGLLGKSGECNVNINCEDDSLWQRLKHSVCKITYNGKLCSGVLINNTNNDGTPYLLTANHCINNNIDANFAIFYFNYESPTCENQDGTESQSVSSSELIATPPYKSLDFSLLRLSSSPPPAYKPYYAGWNRDIQNPTTVTSIHHPLGDVKKISQALDGAVISNYGEGYNEFTHWWIDTWDVGTTEDGSSGSPLFNQDGLLIGDLSGGDASCAYNFNDYYQQFGASWKHFTDSSHQLKCWLDPSETGALKLSGYQPYDSLPSNLKAVALDTLVKLYWNVPIDSSKVYKYYIYRNATLLDSTSKYNYTDSTIIKNKQYSYWVTAKYKSPTIYESNPSNTVTIKLMDPLLIPFTENFESGSKIPNDWYQEKIGSSALWTFKEGGFAGVLDTAYEGSVNAYFYAINSDRAKLILPRLNFNGSDNAILSFYIHLQNELTSVNKLNILYKQKDSLDWKLLKSYNSRIMGWEKKKIPLPNLSDNYQIAFEGIGDEGYGIALDSVRIYKDSNYINPDIITSKDTICISDSVFISTSVSMSHDIVWEFGPGASPSKASGSGPHKVKYYSQGVKYAKITVDNTYTKDSLDLVNVFEIPKPDFTQEGNILTSNLNYGNQWFLDGKTIINATEQTLTALEEGIYSVSVSNNLGCSEISQSKFVIINSSNTDKNPTIDNFAIYPNPNRGSFVLQVPSSTNDRSFYISDITGRICYEGVIKSYQETKSIDLNLNSGMYFVTLILDKGLISKKIVLKK